MTERRIFVLGGGFSDGTSVDLDRALLDLPRVKRPKVVFLPTASGDAQGYIDRFHEAFAERAVASHVELFRRELAEDDLRAAILGSDIVYVGGGNTANMLATWRLHGMDRILREAYTNGVILAGISAGAICWFESCLTDSFGGLSPLDDGLGLLRGSACPHHNAEGRAPAYRRAISAGALSAGLGIDDGAAGLFADERLVRVISSSVGSTLHAVTGDSEPHGEQGEA